MPRMKAPSMVTSDTTSERHEHRSRLLQAMAGVSASKGVAAATIADIVREAGVSKRTFYEHFDRKDACFLALPAAQCIGTAHVARAGAARSHRAQCRCT